MTEATPLLVTPSPTYSILDIRNRLLLNNNRRLKAILQILLLFSVSILTVYLILKIFLPPLTEEQRKVIQLPKGVEDLQSLNKVLVEYMDQYYYSVMTVYVVVYIFLQTFSIPGSMWLSILGGALFRLVIALLLVCICSAVGATNCYLLSRKFGKTLVRERLSERLDRWAEQLQSHSHHLLNYMIVLRLSPFPPNWFANIAAPHVGVPLMVFFIGTLFGVAPPSLIHIQAGLTIEQLTNSSGLKLFSFANVGALILIGLAVLLPVWLRRRFGRVEHELNDENNQINDNTSPVVQVA